MKARGSRVKVDDRSEKIGLKIRESQLKKVNYSLTIGQDEVNNNEISVRKRDINDVGSKNTDELINELVDEYQNRK